MPLLRRTRTVHHLLLTGALGLALGMLPLDLPFGPPVRPAAADVTFTFDGGGFGHGVGASQYGMRGMALAGRNHVEILTHYYKDTAVVPASQPENLRIKLGYAASTTVTPTSPMTGLENDQHRSNFAHGEAVRVWAAHGGVMWQGHPDWAPQGPFYGNVELRFDQGSPARVSLTNQRYQWGRVRFHNKGGTLEVIVSKLSMEKYLYGLGEVPSSWEMAALKAQAIAGRSYAKEAVDRRRNDSSRTWDLDATTLDQAYVGFEKETGDYSTYWKAAVDGTAHQVVQHDGKTIQAFYSSSSGGHTENSEYVFVASLPYARATSDPHDATPSNKNNTWTRSYSGSELATWLVARYGGPSIGSIIDVEITGNIGPSGRIDRADVRLRGNSGTRNLTGVQFRSMINSYAGSGRTLLSSKLTMRSNAPFGSFDSISRAPGGARVSGWTIDPTTTDPIEAHVYVDGVGRAVLPANASRPDVGQAYPAYGSAHGFNGNVPVPTGSHTVCVYGVGQVRSSLLGCRSITVAHDPFGAIDAASGSAGTVQLSGWAIDPDTSNPIDVHVYVDGAGAGVAKANRTRSDVGKAFPAYGAAHGYSVAIGATEGSHHVCAYAINVGSGGNSLLGCRTVNVQKTPFGSVDAVSRTPSGVRVAGWAIDPNTSAPIDVHVYVDGAGAAALTASRSRPDVGGAYPAYGPNHGYDVTVPASGAPHTVCVYAINVGPGGNALLGCRSV